MTDWMVRNQPSIHTFPLHPSIHQMASINQSTLSAQAITQKPKPVPICRSTHNPDDPKGRRITLEIRVHTIRTTRADIPNLCMRG
jgi:hypothetical protein